MHATGQNKTRWNEQYQQGKEFLKLGRYRLAMQTLKPLTTEFENNVDVRYASFYYAVAAWHNGDVIEAKNMFLQLKHKYPDWNKAGEINLWLIKIYFDEGQFERARDLMRELHTDDLKESARQLEADYLSKLSYEDLYEMITGNTNDQEIAKALANRITEKPLHKQDRALLENIVTVFDLDPAQYQLGETEESVKKDTYHVAVLLPFLLDELKNLQMNISNRFVIELYEGIKAGMRKLEKKGISIQLHAYDTKKDSVVTREILNLPELKSMDLIIGPLWPGPVILVNEFSFTNKINMINPLSSNQEIIDRNPYALLFMPSSRTMGIKTAEYMAEHAGENKNYFIFYGPSLKDSVLAYSYKKTMEDAEFQLCHMQRVRTDEGKAILDVLTNSVTVEKEDTEYDSLVIAPDSLGHVFIASDKAPLAANAITALQTRGDHITLVGKYQWLKYREISVDPLEQLHAHLIAPAFIDKKSTLYLRTVKKYLETHHALPGDNYFIGFDLAAIVGKLMYDFGTHFQSTPGASAFIKGTFLPGYFLNGHNNNQYVPIVEFEDSDLHILNPPEEDTGH
jgi:hypothetical protein